ncbi:AAEL003629-PA [Aedes aegypti]|uniref:Odorant receptor n=2 Tax=Aedes aegypti TaxID=7159 RepID=Q17EY1_AEDAE|nr:odorant receptor 25 [Aedes aegypti]EAT45078.2 AAEL003629-PA [Aedes aegypti]DAA80372.1 TPA_exp: odorant receptor 25 [Aedes aegypti]
MEDAKFGLIFRFIRRALSVAGCDIFEENWRPSAWTFIVLLFASIFPYFAVVFLLNHHDDMSYERLAESVAIFITSLDGIYGLLEFIVNRNKWNEVMKNIHSRRFQYKSKTISELFDLYYYRNYQFCKVLYSAYISSAVSILLAPFVFPIPEQYDLPAACTISLIEPAEPYFYPVNYIFQAIVIFSVQHVLIAQCLSLVTGIMSACCQIRALKIKIDELNEQIADPNIKAGTVRESLGEIIYLHQCTKEFIVIIQRKYGVVYLSMYMVCGGIVCMCLNVIAQNIFTSATLLTMAGVFSVFVHCFFGNLLLIENDSLPDKIYALDWHELDIAQQKSLKLLLENAQPDSLLHGILMPLNMSTFVSIMKAAFSYYSILSKKQNS